MVSKWNRRSLLAQMEPHEHITSWETIHRIFRALICNMHTRQEAVSVVVWMFGQVMRGLGGKGCRT